MDFKEIIKRHLDKMAQQDFAFAERSKDEKKSLDKCIQYITSQAKKQAKGGCAAIEDAVVYGWAVHYYQEDEPGEIKNGISESCTYVTNHQIELTEEEIEAAKQKALDEIKIKAGEILCMTACWYDGDELDEKEGFAVLVQRVD